MKKVIVLLGVVAVSFSSIFVKFATAPGIVMAFYRMAFSALMMLPVALVKDREAIKTLKPKYWGLSALSGVFLGAHFALFFTGLSYTSVTACTCLIDLEAILVPLIMFIIFKQRQGATGWLAIAIALGGAFALTFAGGVGEGGGLGGNLLSLLAGISVSIYTVMGNVCRKGMTTSLYTAVVYTSATVTTLVASLVMGENVVAYPVKNALLGLALAVVCTLLGHSVFSWGLKYEKASFVSTVKLLEPVFATLLALVLFPKEGLPNWVTILGALLVISGAVLYTVQDVKSKAKLDTLVTTD